MSDIKRPGVRAIVEHVKSAGSKQSPRQLADSCLDAMGMFEVSEGTFDSLVAMAAPWGEVEFDRGDTAACAEEHVAEMIQLIVASREYYSWHDQRNG